MCAGNGIIGLLLCGKTQLKKIVGIEIQQNVSEMAKKSIVYNNLQEKYEMINGDIKNIANLVEKESFDTVTANPPYRKENCGIENKDKTQFIARYETSCNLDDVINAAFYALKEKGSLYMVHRPERIADLMCTMRKYRIEPKLIRLVQPYFEKKPNLVLVKGTKYGNSFLKVLEPLIIYNQDGTYTQELKKIYGIIQVKSANGGI